MLIQGNAMPVFKVTVKDVEVVTRVLYVEADNSDEAETIACEPDLHGKQVHNEYMEGAIHDSVPAQHVPRKFPVYRRPRGGQK